MVGLAVADGRAALATPSGVARTGLEPEVVAAVDDELRPRWVVWSGETAARLLDHGVRLSTCWDLAAVHRLLFGGWRADPGRIWARLHDLPTSALPTVGPLDLFTAVDERADREQPARDDGYLDARVGRRRLGRDA